MQEDLSVHSPYYEGLPKPMVIMSGFIEAGFHVPNHIHPYGQLVYASEGLVSVSTPEGGYIVPPQRAVWIPPHFDHGVSFLQSAEFATVFITSEQAQDLPKQYSVIEVSPLLKELIKQASTFSDDYEWNGPEGRLFRTLKDQVSLAPLIDVYLPLPIDTRAVRICNELQNDPSLNLTLEQWGNKVGASSRTLARQFTKQTGMSFKDWRQRLRLQHAIQLLAEGETVSNVALQVGYESVSSFIAFFQQHLGETPGEHQRMIKP